jgi:hypothetical protein
MSEAERGSASKPGMKLDVLDDEVIITPTGTSYAVTYYKPANSQQMSLSDFLARAWTLANEKARSLCWIG